MSHTEDSGIEELKNKVTKMEADMVAMKLTMEDLKKEVELLKEKPLFLENKDHQGPNVLVKRLTTKATMPKRTEVHDDGSLVESWIVFCSKQTIVKADQFSDIATDLGMTIPDGLVVRTYTFASTTAPRIVPASQDLGSDTKEDEGVHIRMHNRTTEDIEVYEGDPLGVITTVRI